MMVSLVTLALLLNKALMMTKTWPGVVNLGPYPEDRPWVWGLGFVSGF